MNLFLFSVWIFTLQNVFCLRIATEKIYQEIESQFSCVRRLNATDAIGCQSEASGNVGILFIVKNEEDFQWVLTKGNTPPYIPAFPVTEFKKLERLLKLRDSGRISGALVIFDQNETKPAAFSPDNSCPNEQFGLYVNDYKEHSSCPWNPENEVIDLMFEDIEIPVFLIMDANSINNVTKCFDDHNTPADGEKYPLCAVQLFSRMNAVSDTPTCMRRNSLPVIPLSLPMYHCDPLASYNLFSSLFPTSADFELKNRSFIVLATRLDSFSLFSNKAAGAFSVLTTVILLLSIAKTVSEAVDPSEKYNSNVLFAFFDGESWDYIGSSRAAYDMKRGEFQPLNRFYPEYQPAKLSLRHVSHFIELSQVAPFGFQSNVSISFHKDPVSTKNPKVKELVDALFDDISSFIQVDKVDQKSLPPSSLQSFLKEDLEIAGIVLSSFKTEYSNKYYNSFLDTFSNSDFNETVDFLANVSKALSKSILHMIVNRTNIHEQTTKDFISLLVHCFFQETNCTYFNKMFVLPPEEGKPFLTNTITSLYTRDSKNYTMSPYLLAVHRLLLNYTGKTLDDVSHSECIRRRKRNTSFIFEWVSATSNDQKDGRCIRSSCFMTEALSPAFLGESPDWNSKAYSTWTESVWETSSARIFLIPSRSHDITILLIGVAVFLISFCLTALFNLYSASLLSIPPRILTQMPANC